jgi:hypothetical protein
MKKTEKTPPKKGQHEVPGSNPGSPTLENTSLQGGGSKFGSKARAEVWA